MENMAWGLQITVLGMGLVFTLLALLWGLLTLVLLLDRKNEASVDSPVDDTERIAATTDAVDEQTPEPAMAIDLPPERVAAIMIATLKHRQALRRTTQLPSADTLESARTISPWLAAGRVQQNSQWPARGR